MPSSSRGGRRPAGPRAMPGDLSRGKRAMAIVQLPSHIGAVHRQGQADVPQAAVPDGGRGVEPGPKELPRRRSAGFDFPVERPGLGIPAISCRAGERRSRASPELEDGGSILSGRRRPRGRRRLGAGGRSRFAVARTDTARSGWGAWTSAPVEVLRAMRVIRKQDETRARLPTPTASRCDRDDNRRPRSRSARGAE